jgi:hypothetical protein
MLPKWDAHWVWGLCFSLQYGGDLYPFRLQGSVGQVNPERTAICQNREAADVQGPDTLLNFASGCSAVPRTTDAPQQSPRERCGEPPDQKGVLTTEAFQADCTAGISDMDGHPAPVPGFLTPDHGPPLVSPISGLFLLDTQ